MRLRNAELLCGAPIRPNDGGPQTIIECNEKKEIEANLDALHSNLTSMASDIQQMNTRVIESINSVLKAKRSVLAFVMDYADPRAANTILKRNADSIVVSIYTSIVSHELTHYSL